MQASHLAAALDQQRKIEDDLVKVRAVGRTTSNWVARGWVTLSNLFLPAPR
jgi:hypothetical protein